LATQGLPSRSRAFWFIPAKALIWIKHLLRHGAISRDDSATISREHGEAGKLLRRIIRS